MNQFRVHDLPRTATFGRYEHSSYHLNLRALNIIAVDCPPSIAMMDEFNSETDSDYTSYWRDWVCLTDFPNFSSF